MAIASISTITAASPVSWQDAIERGFERAHKTLRNITGLQVLEEKGYVRHEAEGRAYRYHPTVAPEDAGSSALSRIRDAIYHGSSELLFAQLVADRGLTRKQLERMRRLLAERLEEEER